MKIKLRFPLFVFILGVSSGFLQSYYDSNDANSTSDFLLGIGFISFLLFIMYIFEKKGVSNKKIHFLYAFFLILLGFIFDLFVKLA
jgi:hypothetical protein